VLVNFSFRWFRGRNRGPNGKNSALSGWKPLCYDKSAAGAGYSAEMTLEEHSSTLRPSRRFAADRHRAVAVLTAVLFALPYTVWSAPVPSAEDDQQNAESATIIQNYLQANQSQEDALRGMSMEVNISASIPGWKKQATLTALRSISKVGKITYHVLKFQGDNTIKSEVIARYLTAEKQAQGDNTMAITPQNYKFKYRGEKAQGGEEVYVFQLAPRKKKVGLFKGEMWLDAKSYLPVYEKGRLVKNPSIFFKKVDFERQFAIRNGVAVPERMTSIIHARFVGKVELTINYNSVPEATPATDTEKHAVLVTAVVPPI